MRRLVPLFAVLLIVTAGCTGTPTDPGSSVSDDPTTSTKATTATTTTTTTVPLEASFAPGVGPEGVTNLTALLEAHAATLTDRGFVLSMNQTRNRNEDAAVTATQRLVAESGLREYRRSTTADVRGHLVESFQWANESTILVRRVNGSETRYSSTDLPEWSNHSREWRASGITGIDRMRSLLDGADFERRNVTTVDGERIATFVAEDVGGDDPDARYGSRDVHLVVSELGYVHTLKVVGDLPEGGHFTFEYHVADLGIDDVTRPAWVAEAPTPVEAQVSVDFDSCERNALTLEHDGGDVVPAGTVIEVEIDDERREVELESPLRTGDVRYLAVVDGNLVVTEEKPVAADVRSLPQQVSFSVTTGGFDLASGSFAMACESASEGESGT